MPILHASGGLIYHWRAWRYGRCLWAPFHAQVAEWLAGWRPPASHLVLVGPSAGYALTRDFLARFHRITVLEPDFLARRGLRRRFPAMALDFAGSPECRFLAQPDGFAELARRYPDAAFLFCNLLGQQLVGQDAGLDRRAWLGGLAAALARRDWASWHDLASTAVPPLTRTPLYLARAEPLETVCGHFWRGGESEVLALWDHGCDGMAPERPRHYAVWALLPDRFHLVEWLTGKDMDEHAA